MIFLEFVALVFLMVFVPIPVGWIILHPKMRLWRRIGVVTYGVIVVLWLGVAALIFSYRGVLLASQYEFRVFPFLAGILALVFVWYLDRMRAQQFDWRKLIGLPEVLPQRYKPVLVTSGVYGKVRHPRYVEYMLFSWGVALVSRFFWVYVAGLYMTMSLYVLVVVEERELRQRFGKVYEDYCKKVPRFVPKW